MLEPHISVTGVCHGWEVRDMLSEFNLHAKNKKRQLAIGVMMTPESLHEQPNKIPGKFASKRKVASIFYSDQTYNCLHYVDDPNNPELFNDLTGAIAAGGIGIHALQLDMVWPDPSDIFNAVHASRKSIDVILQLSGRALAEVGNNPSTLLRKLEDYETVIEWVLLDTSLGRGQELNESFLRPYIEALHRYAPHFGVGVAGGLGPGRMEKLRKLLEDYPNLSWDAQKLLHADANIEKDLDMQACAMYLRESLELVSERMFTL